jgi:MSHA biogenesis protein MshQ
MTVKKIRFMVGLLLASLIASGAQAANYILPAGIGTSPFASCSLASGTTYNCTSSITLGNNTVVTATTPLTLNITGNLSVSDNSSLGSASFPISVVASGTITITNNGAVTGNVTAPNGTVALGDNSTVTGNVIGDTVTKVGKVTVSGVTCSGACPWVVKTADAFTKAVGATVTYTISATNISSTTAISSFVITDSVPSGLTYQSCTAPSGGGCGSLLGIPYIQNCSGIYLSCSLAANASFSGTLTFKTTASGTITNTATGLSGLTNKGSDQETITVASSSVPTVTTLAASNITSTAATLNGTVTSNGASTAVTFNYGLTTGYGTTVTAVESPLAASASSASVTYALTGLSCGTTYNFRASGNNSAGPTNGSNLTFTTSSCISSFSAYESNITNTNAATSTNRVITTRVASTNGNLCPNGLTTTASTLPSAAKTCSLTIAGFNAGAVSTTFSGSVSVKLQYCSNVSRSGSGTSSTVTCGGTWADLTTAQTVTLASGVGVATFAFVNNAYEVVRVYINSSALGITSYADDYFAIRPTGLTVTASDASSSTAGNVRSLSSATNNSTCTGSGGLTACIHKAGQYFTLNAQAYVTSSGTTASNYRGTGAGPVSQTVSTTSPTGTGLVNGTLTPGTWSGSGTVTSSTATYSEVGTFTLTLEDQDYANVDKNDGSTTAERYFSGSASLGRFTPDHFSTSVTQGCSTFTYSGQPFTTTITAYNGLSTPTGTKNYSLTTNTVRLSDAGTDTYLTNKIVASSSFSVSTGIATTPTTPTSTALVYTFASKSTVPRQITVRATDDDSISSSGYETSATTTIVSGRLNLVNSYGSELLALPVVAKVEYYDGTGTTAGWRQATSSYVDTCTSIAATDLAFGSVSACSTAVNSCNTGASLTATLSGGVYKSPWALSLAKPTATGSVCVTANLDGSAAGKSCASAGATPATPTAVKSNGTAGAAWLMYPWTSATATNPTARATFGVYKSPLIYRRENY